MQYTINAINGGEIKVTFADGSYANVAIETNDSLDIIDEKVGRFTNVYTIDDAPNPLISVGEVRQTIDPDVAQAARDAAKQAEFEAAQAADADIFRVDFGNIDSIITPFSFYVLAQTLAAEGDTSLVDMINARVHANVCGNPDYDLDAIKAAFNDTL